MELKRGLLFGLGVFVALAIILTYMGSASADSTPLSAKSSDTDHTITVTGTGSVDVVPDIAKLSVGVITTADKSADAMSKNAQTMDAVVKAIKNMGIGDKDLRTSTVSIDPVYNYNTQPKDTNAPPQIVGYRATNTVTVTLRDMSQVGAIIDAASAAGANQINGVSFQLSDDLSKATYKQALTKAISDGADKAKTISSSAGVGNVTLKSITESGAVYPQPYYENVGTFGAAPMAASTPVSAGQQKVQATVTMVYTFG